MVHDGKKYNADEFCRHPLCRDTNWWGRDRVHTRFKGECPPDPDGQYLDLREGDDPKWLDVSVPQRLVLNMARDLRSVDGENVEYDRALVELVRDVVGITYEEARVAVLGPPPLSQKRIDEIRDFLAQNVKVEVIATAITDRRNDPFAYVTDAIAQLQRILNKDGACHNPISCPVHRPIEEPA